MDGLAVFERDYTKYTQFTVARILNFDPVANTPVCLALAPQWRHKRCGAPRAHDIGALADDLFLKVTRGLHVRQPPAPFIAARPIARMRAISSNVKFLLRRAGLFTTRGFA
jgi:hypothetical protein